MKSVIGVPLKTGEKSIGVIELVNKSNGKPFTALELRLLSTIADFAAIAIERQFSILALKKISRTDYLTGVMNRRSFDRVLTLEAERCKRHSMVLSLLIIDIDNFKRINDQYGHPAGDRTLRNCAEILISSVRRIDTVARYGGDEFAVLMPNTGRNEAEVVRNRILQAVAARNSDKREIPLELTTGLHCAGPEGLGDIIGESDPDTYRNKEPGELGSYLLQMSMDDPKEEL